jgi:regulator of sigma E protease
LQLLLVILEVAVGLGMVIFVHELGHFLVAKWCGVKCEKFYLGFDIYGLKLFHYQWGETEYGIGILPLGGYVKMLGQDDNPARAAAERERSLVHVPHGDLPAEPTEESEHEHPLHDPRSYLAKSVPQRMAIISAGVVMNVIFAFVMAAVAYSIGVSDQACGISAVMPGEAAWRADLRPGDKIREINNSGDRQLRFRDLMTAVALANVDKGVDFFIEREGVKEPFWVNVKPDPDTKRLRPTIGVGSPQLPKVSDQYVALAGTPAAKIDKFKPGDRIVEIGGVPIKGFVDYEAQLARHPDETLKFAVERTPKVDAGSQGAAKPELVEIDVTPRPMRTLGLVMKMGKITAVQRHSPAEAAGIRPGDFITSVDGQEPGDPMRLPDRLRRRAGETIKLALSRQGSAGENETIERDITLRDAPWTDEPDAGSPVSVPSLGIAYKVLNVVHQTEKDSPAAQAQLTKDGKPANVPLFASGDQIVEAVFIVPKPKEGLTEEQKKEQAERDKLERKIAQPEPLKFGEESPNWPVFVALLQMLPEGSQVKLTLSDGRTATLSPVDAADWHVADRGLINAPDMTFTQAHSFGEAVSLGWRETYEAVLQVYLFLQRLGTQISPFALGGPKTIAQAAGLAAYDGVSQLLIFLTLLSANLAVVNFLPIPLLDGGHMVFLILEGILRRPVSERVQVAFHYAGFVFIISLMLFVLGLDFNVIPRH